MGFILLHSSCLKYKLLGLALIPAAEICLGKGARWCMTSRSEGFCLMATHIWISPRVVGPCYSEDKPKGLLSGSKGRKYDTSGQMLKPQGEKGEEGSTLSQTARFLVQVFWGSPRAFAVFIAPLWHRSTLFLVLCSYLLKKVHVFPYDFIHPVHSQLVLETLSSLFLNGQSKGTSISS